MRYIVYPSHTVLLSFFPLHPIQSDQQTATREPAFPEVPNASPLPYLTVLGGQLYEQHQPGNLLRSKSPVA